jgi:uncharacterized protein
MNKLTLIIALATAMVGAHAQTKEDLAKRIIELQRPAFENVGRTAAALPANQMMQVAASSLRRVPADQREKVGKQMESDVRQFHADVEALLRQRAVALAPATVQPLLLEKFSESELKQLVAWFETPVAKKFQDVSPEFTAALSRKLVAETRGDVGPKLKALQETLNGRLTAVMPARPPASGASK